MKTLRIALIFSGLLFLAPELSAQNPNPISRETAEDIHVLDSTWQAFRKQQRLEYKYRVINSPGPATTSSSHKYGWVEDSVYQERLNLLCHVVPMVYNEHVRGQIEYFTGRKRQFFEEMLGLQHIYFPIFNQVFDQMDMPLELRYLSIIESGLVPVAKSRVAATGLWQFMHYTAALYDIRMDSYIDERSDPYKATVAAAQYLQHLHSLYDDWLLAIAAYNCGPGRVNWAIRKAGVKDVWKIYKYLPRETRGYVPAFIAACYTMNYWREHHMKPVWVDFEYGPDSLVVYKKELRLDHLAKCAGVDPNLLYAMNPALKTGVVPYSDKPFTVRIPHNVALYIEQNPDTIYQHNNVSEAGQLATTTSSPTYVPPGRRLINHPVKAGETLVSIAYYYTVYVNDIKRWNSLSSNYLRPGQELKVFVRSSNRITQAPTQSTVKLTGKTGTAPKASNTTPKASNGRYSTYRVRNGDSLWLIAKRYPGVSVDDILKLNRLANADKIRPGQTLKIPNK